ncbi:Transcription factor IIIA [Folsomia candida]|uniref:Transcription factor IIIA n=1 Tax=Folsomia candida TaxID=158441 RepID=A0A226DRV2_FOLCA|nr:Transcription factor IIIA [Folsomia candida]
MESQVAKSLAQFRRQGQRITKIIPPPPPPRTFNGQQQQQVRRSLRNQNSTKIVKPILAKDKGICRKIDNSHVRGQKEGDISFKIKEEEEDICFVQLCEDGPSPALVFEEVLGEMNDVEMENDDQLESTSNQSEHDNDDPIFDEPDDVQNMSDDECSNYSPESGDDSDAEPPPIRSSVPFVPKNSPLSKPGFGKTRGFTLKTTTPGFYWVLGFTGFYWVLLVKPCKTPKPQPRKTQGRNTLVETKNRHVRLQHDDSFTRIPCPADDCDLAFKRFDHLRNHLKRKHPDVSFPKIRKSGDNASSNKIPCPVSTCDKTYSRNDHLNIHIRAAHPDVPVKSRKKGATPKKSRRSEKEKDNSPPCPDDDGIFDPLKCSVCFKKFSSVETTDRHFRHQHDETFIPLLCPSDNCDLTFKRRDHLKRHLDKIHPDFVPPKVEPFPPTDSDSDSIHNPLKCSVCFKKLGTVDTKERHFRHMHDETFTRLPCPADNCDLSFKRRTHLHRHLKRKHPTVPFFTMCSRSRPVRKDDFEHLGDRIPCPVATCEKTYSRTDHLNTPHPHPDHIHIRTTHPDTPVIKGSKMGKKYGSKVPETRPCPVFDLKLVRISGDRNRSLGKAAKLYPPHSTGMCSHLHSNWLTGT